MPPILLRLRPKNQLTLPNNVLDKLGVKPGDFLEVVAGPGDTIQLVPARLVREGTKEAAEVHRRASEDFAAGRYHTFNSVEDVMRALDEPAAPSAQPLPIAIGDSRLLGGVCQCHIFRHGQPHKAQNTHAKKIASMELLAIAQPVVIHEVSPGFHWGDMPRMAGRLVIEIELPCRNQCP